SPTLDTVFSCIIGIVISGNIPHWDTNSGQTTGYMAKKIEIIENNISQRNTKLCINANQVGQDILRHIKYLFVIALLCVTKYQSFYFIGILRRIKWKVDHIGQSSCWWESIKLFPRQTS